jgi:hypothetical protein
MVQGLGNIHRIATLFHVHGETILRQPSTKSCLEIAMAFLCPIPHEVYDLYNLAGSLQVGDGYSRRLPTLDQNGIFVGFYAALACSFYRR